MPFDIRWRAEGKEARRNRDSLSPCNMHITLLARKLWRLSRARIFQATLWKLVQGATSKLAVKRERTKHADEFVSLVYSRYIAFANESVHSQPRLLCHVCTYLKRKSSLRARKARISGWSLRFLYSMEFYRVIFDDWEWRGTQESYGAEN